VTAGLAEPLLSSSRPGAAVPSDLLPDQVVRVDLAPADQPAPAQPAVKTCRVAVVVPCFNRKADAQALLTDLARVTPRWAGGDIDLRVLLVDNASAEPLSDLPTPPGLNLQHLRLSRNTGGSGGYNAGMRRVLSLDDQNDEALAWRAWDAHYTWLVDSDARVAPDTLAALIDVMERDPAIVAAGSAICDPVTGQAFELGGTINRRTGDFDPVVTGRVGVRDLVDCDYLAACCALVRSAAIRDSGVFPDRFLNGDDVEWFIRMKAMTGGRIVAVPWSLAMHPRFDRFATWPRYYMSRNAFGPLEAVGAPPRLLFRRALTEVPRAVQQAMMGRADLARLHLAGLRHAAQHRTVGPAPEGLIRVDTPVPLDRLSQTLLAELGMGRARPTQGRILARLAVSDAQRALISDQLTRAGVVVRKGRDGARPAGFVRALWGAGRRLLLGPEVDVAVVPARGRPDSWFLGRLTVAVSPQGFLLRRSNRFALAARGILTGLRGVQLAARVARRGLEPVAQGGGGPWLQPHQPAAEADRPAFALSLCAVILSYNRWAALDQTLKTLRQTGLFQIDPTSPADPPAPRRWSVMVVDNASTDGTPERLESEYPGVRLLKLDRNMGVDAFNRGVAACDTDAVLILDDDAAPDERALRRAMELLARRPDLAAVAMHPRHPTSGRSEWSFAGGLDGSTCDHWPVMGCGNLVRRDAWLAAGGYEPGYFLYRNDTDLALKLLGLGYGVHFNPAWVVWHDTGAGAGTRKSLNWHRIATRNWIWLARRHGGGFRRGLTWRGALLGWLWAHKLAGLSPARHVATLRGAIAGFRQPAPALDPRIRSAAAFDDLLRRLIERD
jgi:GT2 family glycosyltransferase